MGVETPRAFLIVDGGILFPSWAINHARNVWLEIQSLAQKQGMRIAFSEKYHGFVLHPGNGIPFEEIHYIDPCWSCGTEISEIGVGLCSDCLEKKKIKMRARNYACIAEKKGILKRQPCEICASDKAEKHHEDYSKPLEVRWLCRQCHLAVHAEMD